MKLSLPTDSAVRKTYPLFNGLFGYFGAALAAVAHHSWKSNEKHNKGQPLHWSMDKSNDHADCIVRHLADLGDMLATFERPGEFIQGDVQDAPSIEDVLYEADALAWRALALNQTLRMQFGRAPQPFNARRSWQPELHAQPAPGHTEGYPADRCGKCRTQPCSCRSA